MTQKSRRTLVWHLAMALVVCAWGPTVAQEIPDSVDHAVPPWHEQEKADSPDWFKGSFQLDGVWLTNPPAWYVPAEADAGQGSLFIMLDREVLTNDLAMEIEMLDYEGSSLYLQLLSTNFAEVVTDMFGNLVSGSGEIVRLSLDLPMSDYRDAAIIRLLRESGDILVYESSLRVRAASVARIQDPESTDAGGVLKRQAENKGVAKSDGKGGDKSPETQAKRAKASEAKNEKGRSARILYVDGINGDDTFEGRHVSRNGKTAEGPKKSVRAAMAIAKAGDTVSVGAGTYRESVNPPHGVTLSCRGHVRFR